MEVLQSSGLSTVDAQVQQALRQYLFAASAGGAGSRHGSGPLPSGAGFLSNGRLFRRSSRWRPSILELALLLLIIGGAGWGVRSLGEVVESHVVAKREEAIDGLFTAVESERQLPRHFTLVAARHRDSRPDHLQRRQSRATVDVDPSAAAEVQPESTPHHVWIRSLHCAKCSLVDSRLTVDLERDQELVQVLQAFGLAAGGTGDSVAVEGVELPPVTLAGVNLGVTLQAPGFRLELGDLFFRVRAGERLRVTARGSARAWPPANSRTAWPDSGRHLDADFRVSGTTAHRSERRRAHRPPCRTDFGAGSRWSPWICR